MMPNPRPFSVHWRLALLPLLCPVLGAFIGCGGPSAPSTIESPVTISCEVPLAVDAGDKVTLVAAVAGDLQHEGVTWMLSNNPMSYSLTSETTATFTPSAANTSTLAYTVTAISKAFPGESASITITVNALPEITSSGLMAAATEGSPYSVTLNAANGTGGLSWSMANSTVLPTGLVLNPNGTITGTPPGPTVTNWKFSVQVTDSDAPMPHTSAPSQLSISVFNYALPSFSINTLPNAAVGVPYSQTISIVGGHPPFTMVIPDVPAGLSVVSGVSTKGAPQRNVVGQAVEADSLKIFGTPTAVGNHDAISVVMADSSNPVQDNSIIYYVDVLPAGSNQPEIIADASQPGPTMVKEQLGVNLAFYYPQAFDPVYAPLFSAAGVGLVRWPGGSQADFYHWQTGAPSSCDPSQPVPHSFDDFMQTIPAALQASVAITANYGSNSDCTGPDDPNEAAAWVNYANNVQHYGIKYWTIGNEEYYPQFVLSPTPYNIDPTAYANAVATQFYPLMKAQDPNVMVGVDTAVASAETMSASSDNWDYIVLAQAKYDFVEMHYYPFSYNTDDDTTVLTTWANQLAGDFEWARGVVTLKGHPNVPIFLGEFDRDAGGPLAVEHESVSVVNALFNAIVLAEVAKAGVPMATAWVGLDGCYADTLAPPLTTAYGWQSFGSWGLFATAGVCPQYGVPTLTPFPKARAYQIMREFIVPGEHTIAAASTDQSIRAYAATSGTGYALLLINTDSASTHTLPVKVGNTPQSSYTATTLIYGKEQYDESQTGIWAGPVTNNLGTVGTTFDISLPPWSIALVKLQ